MPGSRVRVPPLLSSQASHSHGDAGLCSSRFLGFGSSLATRLATRPDHFASSRAAAACPAVALFRVRLEPAVHLRHHRHVALPELAGDQLERRTRARHPHRPAMSGIVQPVVGPAERPPTERRPRWKWSPPLFRTCVAPLRRRADESVDTLPGLMAPDADTFDSPWADEPAIRVLKKHPGIAEQHIERFSNEYLQNVVSRARSQGPDNAAMT